MKVGEKDRRPPAVKGGAVPTDDAQHHIRQGDGDDNDQRRGREDPAASPTVEGEY